MNAAGKRGLCLAMLLLAGCSEKLTVLSLTGRACDPAPRLSREHPVDLGSSDGTTVAFDEAAPCVITPNGPASYAVYALPETSSRYRLTLRSMPRGQALIWPDATIYGADDRPRRHVDSVREAAGGVVGTATGEPGDRYLVITSTPGTIGRREAVPTADAAPPIRLASTIIIIPTAPVTPIGPISDKFPAVLAHSGRVTVTALPFVALP